jgi:F0F1-type ATP synthase delta subunit
MKIPRNILVPILAELSGKLPAKKLADEVAGYLLGENRTGELDSIVRDLVDYRAEHGIVEVNAVSAHQITESALKEVRQNVRKLYPNAHQIIINQRLDGEQIGGVRLEFPGRQLDLSLRAKINEFKQLTAVNK